MANNTETGEECRRCRQGTKCPVGKVDVVSTDLELCNEVAGSGTAAHGWNNGCDQVVGIRFGSVGFSGSVSLAFLSLFVDEVPEGKAGKPADERELPVTLVIHAEAVGDAARISPKSSDISSRKRTKASVEWSPGTWNKMG